MSGHPVVIQAGANNKGKGILARSFLSWKLTCVIFIVGLEVEQRASHTLASVVPPSYPQLSPSFLLENLSVVWGL